LARALIVGCGCGGRELGARLLEGGWQVRGTSRDREGVARIDEAGLEGAIADPNLPGTVLDLVGDIAVIVWLLGSAAGDPAEVAAIHGPRLETLLERLVDTPVRAFAYEDSGHLEPELLRRGREIVERAARAWRIPVALIGEGERSAPDWPELTAEAVRGLLAVG
jgi:hypothetical protein